MQEPNNILSLLDNYMMTNPDDIAKGLADDFRRRRIEKNLTRDQIAELSNVAVSNIVRFEQKGLTSPWNPPFITRTASAMPSMSCQNTGLLP